MNFDHILQNVRQHIPLSQEEADLFTSLLDARVFKKKSFLLHSGDVCLCETFVVKGCVKIFYTDAAGVEHIVKFAVENWWTMDLESFAQQTPAFYTIQALEDTETLQLSKTNHDVLYERVPQFEKFSRLQFQNAYILLQHRLTQNLYLSAEEKYNRFTEKYPGLELRIPQKEIASYLGITPEFLSMLRKRRMKPAIS
ncbi:Crp/Fnr family transcriptional regulator [Chryseolinea lacunae]|uniref:Crp/Fnr family transcriptional regulator n=1 Tax=Chryseolinea lacunae TaxID=2801331 RepID=A0ABS1KSH5_9BACT|nr:Crp/Fnr family transcriptional regulator [Chryseolinea lacunae]MBL0742410.1 Crp/Fnr family transcriptional regulator [Chryseolinea lacunae]